MVGSYPSLWQRIAMVKKTFFYCNKITLSGVEPPDVTPIVMGPSGRKFSFSTNSPCYCKVTLKQFKDKYLEKMRGEEKENGKKIWNLISIETLELYAFILTFSLYAILLPGPILFSLSIQYEGIPRSSAISCRCEVLLEFHPPITNIRSNFSSTSLYIASWRSWQ